MNIFENVDGFIGGNSAADLCLAHEKLREQAAKIREKLGEQAYLLDRYLSCLLTAAGNTSAYSAVTRGFDRAAELQVLCGNVIGRKEKNQEHPFYEQARTFIEGHPLNFQEEATSQVCYTALLADDFLEFAAKEFYGQERNELAAVLDICELRQLYRRIFGLLGGETQMETLNLLFQRRFLIASPVDCFMQGLADSLMDSLAFRDMETGRLVFQVI